MRRLLRTLLALAVGLVLLDLGLSLLSFEDGLFLGRPLPPFEAVTHPRQRQWLARQRAELARPGVESEPGAFDPELGWCVRPGWTSADGAQRYGSLGARGPREYAPAPPPGTLRAVACGDSFTHCDFVADADTWQARMEAADPRLEVLNLGVGGYGTDQALLRFRRDGAALAPDVVLIGMLLENVGRNVNRYRPLWYPQTGSTAAKPRFVLDGSGDLRLVPLPLATRGELVDAVESGDVLELLAEHEHWGRGALGPLRHSSLARLAAGFLAYRARGVRRLWLDLEGEPRRVTLALLRAFHREALAAGARAAPVLVFPRRGDLAPLVEGDDGARYWRGLLDELAAEGIPAIDLAPPLAEAYRALGGMPDERGDDPLYARGHLNPAGNAIVASVLLAWLDEHVRVPSND